MFKHEVTIRLHYKYYATVLEEKVEWEGYAKAKAEKDENWKFKITERPLADINLCPTVEEFETLIEQNFEKILNIKDVEY